MQRVLILREDGTMDTATDPDGLERALKDARSLVWVDAENETPETLQRLGSLFNLHPVTIEDLINRDQRPKIEEFEQYTFLVIHSLRAIRGDEVETDELHIALKANCLLTTHGQPLETVKRLFDRRAADPALLQHGSGFLLYLLGDAVVDGYFPVLDALGDEIDHLEDAVIAAPARARMHRIFEVKRVLVQLRKIVSPQREVFNALSRRDSPYIGVNTAVYFRDVHDHLVRAFEIIDSYRDLVANTLDAYLAGISNRLGQVMKQLTVIATIFMPLSFLTGFFGMNFTAIPYDRPWLLGLLLATILGLPVAMILFFLRRGWIADSRRITTWNRLRAWLRSRR
ncbi:MAG TPA: magnesium/cobalt transporter CorA [Candidatus Methylomirabilis sp.]|nr:magnesium/cobalt transporter CorA [Candidatus Methylomirabilis sp.]